MPRERDRFREYVEYVEKNKWKCLFCDDEYSGSAPRIRAHLAGLPDKGIKVCKKVDPHVRAEALQTFYGKGSAFDVCTGGTSGEGTEGIVPGASQILSQSDNASNPNATQNSNQPGGVPLQPSCYWPAETACPQYQVSLSTGATPPNNIDTSQPQDLSDHRLDATHGSDIASSPQQLLMDSLASPLVDFSELLAFLDSTTHLEPGSEQQNSRGLSSSPNDQVLGNSMSNGEQGFNGDGIAPDPPLYSTDWSNHHCSLLENLLESRDVHGNPFEEIQMNEVHNPTVGSSSQIDSSLDVDIAYSLQDCRQPRVVGVDPVWSNTTPTDTVQHPGQLLPRCDKEDGNDIFPSQAPMDMDIQTSTNTVGPSSSQASMPPQHQSVPHQSINLEIVHQNPAAPSSSWENHLIPCHPQALMDMDPCMPSSSQTPNNAPLPPQILPCGTGLTGSSSLPELNMCAGALMMTHPNRRNNFEDNGALKRKLELLYSEEADVRNELEFANSLFLKKPKIGVANWLANVEKLKDCLEAASEVCLPPHQLVDKLVREVEDFRSQGKGLFEVRDTKGRQMLEGKMVGEAFQRKTTAILENLLGNQISPLGIYGMGGVGKTTIMVHIHNRLLEETSCGKVLWITMSQDFNTQRLQDDLWKALGKGMLQEEDVRKRAAMLCNCLTKRGKSIVILDDVWEHFDLKEVGVPDGIKLVLTTRSIEVCRQMRCQEMIIIEPLRDKEAESLFLEELGPEVALDSETRAIVKSIVEECAGLPLAIITMATSMRGVTNVFEWKDCLKKLRESDMGQMDMEKAVLKKLEVSYNRLGKPEVQQCFLSCALYPEDQLIDKFELIEFFIDQGLFDQLEMRKDQYFRGLTILNKLENVCLLEDHGKEVKMHDLIRDLALHIMNATSIVKARKGLRRIPSEEYWTNALEKVSLMQNDIEEFPSNMSPKCPKLLTCLMNDNSWYGAVIPNCFFKQLQGLKVLNLSECRLRELPNSISDLVNLRALLLRRCMELRRIPYLGKLISLRKLDIFDCEQVEALEGLEMLVNLRYLDLSHTHIKRLPTGTLGALLNLQYLKVKAVNGEDFTKLRELETVVCCFEDVDDFNKFVRMPFEKRNNLCHYELHVGKIKWVKYGEFSDDVRFPNWKKIVHINTRSHAIVSARGESDGGDTCILIPEDVRKLIANYCDGATNLSDMGPLENLEELDIYEWKNLRVPYGGQDEEIIGIHDSPAPLLFPNLRVLQLRQCPKLKYLFGHGPKFSLPHLQKISIRECEEMVGIIVAVTSPPPHPPLAFPSLEHISVEECHKMKRVVESEWLPHFPNLRSIKVYDCENMEEIIGGRPPYGPVKEISLEFLSVELCRNMKNLFPHELLIHLQNLQRIKVNDCEGMVEIISEVGQDQEGSITTPVSNTPSSSSQSLIYLPKLKHLKLSFVTQLKNICEVPITCDYMEVLEVLHGGRDEEIISIHDSPVPTLAPPLFPSLIRLEICGFSKLKYVFGHEPKFYLPHLQKIRIYLCEEMVGITVAVTSLPPHPPSAFPSLKDIHVEFCGKMKRVLESEWLPHFPSLESIHVSCCENMEEIIGGPPPRLPAEKISLEYLRVHSCHNMRKLFPHEWLIHLRNLQSIIVADCKGMVEMISGAGQSQEGSTTTPVNNTHSSSPSSISLPKLKHLELSYVPQLKSICEVPITCDSMAFLKVIKCPELSRIPLQLQFHDIEDLPYIDVEGEEKWNTLIWDHPDAQALLQSHLRVCGSYYMLYGRRRSL
ncbi:hypothetical protein BT93_B0274 [Corymbia citriodora subsp. variegata]|nr:hypothetical protein BT93_B0274 [Corymbia citriodora subsp. variegata]